MAHHHKTPDEKLTGPDIIDEDNPTKHYHMLDGLKSSIEDNEEKHTHIIDGQLTSRPIEYNEPKGIKTLNFETKLIGGVVKEVKETERAGVRIGIIEGYIATWDVDRGDIWGVKDQFVKGCFRDSIAEHLKKGRQIRLKDHHGRTVGGFPIDSVREDDRGLFGIGEINLEVQQGFEAYALALQGVLTDFSIGFSVDEFSMDEELRIITKATIWEGSIVDEPMNPEANIVAVKTVVPYQDLQLADRERSWDADAAINRVKEFTESDDAPTADYKKAFLWYDRENQTTFGAYKLPIADVIDGRLRAVPRGIFAAAAALQGARGGVAIPESDRPGVIRHIERYYAKMEMPSPFDDADKQYYVVNDVEGMDVRTLEKALRNTGCFTKSAAKLLAGRFTVVQDVDETHKPDNTKALKDLFNDIKNANKLISNG